MKAERCFRYLAVAGGLFALAASASGCGPTPQEVGSAVLLTAPIALLASFVLLGLLSRAFGDDSPKGRGLGRTRLVQLCVTIALALSQIPSALSTNVDQYLPIVLGLFGSSFLGIVLVCWRVWHAVDPAGARTWAPLPAIALQLLPAILLSTGWLNHFEEADLMIGVLYFFPGCEGVVPAALLIVLLGEALVWRVLARLSSRKMATAEPMRHRAAEDSPNRSSTA